MNASIDTDVVIHLYLSDKHKSIRVYEKFSLDVIEGRIKIVSNSDLNKMGVKRLFDDYLRDYEYLFDRGELYAVSLAKAVGLIALVSDDTKEFGPHQTLVRELIEDVIPFAFYELLFLRYLSGEFTVEEVYMEFNEVTCKSMNKYPMQFRNRMLGTVRRFSHKFGTKRDCEWLNNYCKNNNIDYKKRMQELKQYLSKM